MISWKKLPQKTLASMTEHSALGYETHKDCINIMMASKGDTPTTAIKKHMNNGTDEQEELEVLSSGSLSEKSMARNGSVAKEAEVDSNDSTELLNGDNEEDNKSVNGKLSDNETLKSPDESIQKKKTRSPSKENKAFKEEEQKLDPTKKSKLEADVDNSDCEQESSSEVKDSGKYTDIVNCDSDDSSGDVEACENVSSDSNDDNQEKGTSEKSEKKSEMSLPKEKGADSEKENKNRCPSGGEESDPVIIASPEKAPDKKKIKHSERSDSANDDIEIIGESKVIQINNTNKTQVSQNVVFIPAALTVSTHSNNSQGFTATTGNLIATNSIHNPALVHSLAASTQPGKSGFMATGMPSLPPGFVFNSGIQGQAPPGVSLLTPSVAPPKPKSSLDQIELIRWEIQNRVNTRPKYFKPNAGSELGPLAKFLFDIGSNLVKESVYHELVKIQSKNDDEKLTDKERDDLEKLKEIEKDLYASIGHLKLKLKKHCKGCNFQTESNNVMYLHKQFPHEDNKNLRCAHCNFATRQTMAFKFHLESVHAIQPKLPDKKAFYECDMCPYENNQEQKLILHKQRCIKQFRPLFNLHPGCLSGAEINLCLENIFYKPVIPKNLKLLQQKHAQQQAALAEARRQQAQIQALAAQKNAAAIAARKMQQQKLQTAALAQRFNAPPGGRMPLPGKLPGQPQPVRYNANTKGSRPTVASMLNNRPPNPGSAPAGAQSGGAPSGFEVCEICSGYVKDRKALRIHFFYAHRIDLPFNLFERIQAPLYCATCYVRFWTAQGLRKHIHKHIDSHKEEKQARGVVGKCISCGHHVLNLLLHMRIVHNREMQHYINALMCMFCGGHFSSRQECERHISKAHGNVDPLTGTLRSNTGAPIAAPPAKTASNQKKGGNNSLVKGSVCVLCNLNFGRNVDLTRHCMRMHHTCMKCGMVVIDKASLMKHTCLSSPSGTRDCCMCNETGFHPAYYVKHLRDKHLRKFSVKVSKLDKDVVERWTKRPYPFKDSEQILVEISDSDDDGSANKIKSSVAPKLFGKKPRMGPACKVKKYNDNLAKELANMKMKKVVAEKKAESAEVSESDGSKDTSDEGVKIDDNDKVKEETISDNDIEDVLPVMDKTIKSTELLDIDDSGEKENVDIKIASAKDVRDLNNKVHIDNSESCLNDAKDSVSDVESRTSNDLTLSNKRKLESEISGSDNESEEGDSKSQKSKKLKTEKA
ncbi:unnamed protein product [Lymnaea stagnalis]|uniref:C2H2-type domain-containing protein n=1 Tax=Lymnaea stagnalis TaxID=6523 RepID=A0AAV2HAC9_LYMST